MKIGHWMKNEKSGLAFTKLELVQAEMKQGHEVFVREATGAEGMPGTLLYGSESMTCDVESIHSQMPLTSYHTTTPKFMWMHGEPLSSVGNGVSMKAIVDLRRRLTPLLRCVPKKSVM